MADKDNKQGFSGLKELATNSTSKQNIHPLETSKKSKIKKNTFDLIDLTKWPTLPAPWSSIDSGETWVWGDFFITFQKSPKTIYELTMHMQGKKPEYQSIIHHYAMTVFYRLDLNPHGPSHRPIMTIALEQADFSMVNKLLGDKAGDLLQSENIGNKGSLMIGLFISESRFNLGSYVGETNPEHVKRKFFSILQEQLELEGKPKLIGDLNKAYGHPETGMPENENKKGKYNVKILIAGILVLVAWLFYG